VAFGVGWVGKMLGRKAEASPQELPG
jgi:hypothetical protein